MARYCTQCGSEISEGSSFCAHCGRKLSGANESAKKTVSTETESSSGSRRKDPRRKGRGPLVASIAAAVVAIVIAVLVVVGLPPSDDDPIDSASEQEAEEAYQAYVEFDEGIDAIDESYRNSEGYHDPESLLDLLDEVEQYGLAHPEAITSVERTDTGVSMEMASGIRYEYTPSLEGFLEGGGAGRIITFEPWWTDVDKVTSLHINIESTGLSTPSGFSQFSWVDECGYEVSTVLSEFDFQQEDNLNDGEVSLDGLKRIGRNALVIYFGHGAYDPTYGSFLSTGDRYDSDFYSRHKQEFKNHELAVTSSDNRIAVGPGFFSNTKNFPDGSLEGTDFFLISCHSLEDTKLASSLVGRGARKVTGFTKSVHVVYGLNMLDGILGITETTGLIRVGTDGQYYTYDQSLALAKSRYGQTDGPVTPDEQWPFEWARCEFYPQSSPDETRLSDALVAVLDNEPDENKADDNKPGESLTESTAADAVRAVADNDVLFTFCDDFDGDGAYEAFVITGVAPDASSDQDWVDWEFGTAEIWYVGPNGEVQGISESPGSYVNEVIHDPGGSRCALLSTENYAGGSGSTSNLYTVKNGTWAMVSCDVNPIGSVRLEDGQIVGYTSVWDNGYHQYQTYSFDYDPNALMLRETGKVGDPI